MERMKQVAAVAVVIAILTGTAAWLLRSPQTNAVLIPPASLHR